MFHKVVETLKDTPQYRSRRRVKSGNSGEVYVVSIRKSDGRWACGCKGWIFTYQKKGGDCAHIKEIRETYGDKSRSDAILLDLANFANDLDSLYVGNISVALAKWQVLKDPASMLLFYFENTPTEQTRALALDAMIGKIRAQLARMVLA